MRIQQAGVEDRAGQDGEVNQSTGRTGKMGVFKQLVIGGLLLVMVESPLSGQQENKAPEEFEGATAHCYKKTAEGELYLYVFQPEKGRQRNRPAAVFFFGGGWNGGTPASFRSTHLTWHPGEWSESWRITG